MRYRSTGNLHKDFHLATNATVHYILDTYGDSFLRELFRRTAQQVYRDIYQSLVKGDPTPLIDHWKYYYEREGGTFKVAQEGDAVMFNVESCPAVEHLINSGQQVDDTFYLHIRYLNDGWSEGTPFAIETTVYGPGKYTMAIEPKPGGR